MSRITLISKFANCELSGHALLDDERYFDFLIAAGADFRLYTSRYSTERLAGLRSDTARYVRALEDSVIDIEVGERVVFLGFTELDVLSFIARNLWRRPRLVLVATNNFSDGRVRRLRRSLKLFFYLVRPFLDRLVLHTLYEQQLIMEVDRQVAAKSAIKKHHLMTPHDLTGRPVNNARVVSYFGPIKPEKPIEPFFDLIRADIAQRFSYRIYNVSRSLVAEALSDLEMRTNVEVFEGWQDQASYMAAVRASGLLFLTHNREFEGKLSGNLCDCFALRVPYIARAMEPMVSYHARYGALGYLVDLDDASWARRLLDGYDDELYADMCCNLERLGTDHSAEAIDANLEQCLLK